MLNAGNDFNGAPPRFLSIASLNPYVHRWHIKGRVMVRSPLNTSRNSSKFFHVDLMDAAGDAIRAKFWGDAADKWYEALQPGQVYSFSKGRVMVANKRYSALSNNYELSFNADADIELIIDDGSIRQQQRSTRECPFPADLMVVITEVQGLTSVTAKSNGEELRRRTVRVRDQSQMEMELNLWGEQADLISEDTCLPLVCFITNVVIRDWRGHRSGSSTRQSKIMFLGKDEMSVEDEASAKKLLEWYKETGCTLFFTSMSRGMTGADGASESKKPLEEMTIEALTERGEGMGVIVAQLRRVFWKTRGQQDQQPQEALMYPACPNCKKKMQEGASGDFSCYVCNNINATPDWRFMLSASFIDSTGTLVCRCFADQGNVLVGYPASDLRQWSLDKKQYLMEWDLLFDAWFRISIRSEMTTYNGEQRLRHTAMRIEMLDPSTLSALLLRNILAAVPNAMESVQSRKMKWDDIKGEISENDCPNTKRERLETADFLTPADAPGPMEL